MSFENPETLNFKPIMVSINKGETPRGELGYADMKVICDKLKFLSGVIRFNSIVRTILETEACELSIPSYPSALADYTVACSYMVESSVA
jgi:hypothetical protein